MLEQVRKFNELCKSKGFPYALKESFNIWKSILANIFPKKRNATLNGVEIPSSEKRPHLKNEKFIPFYKGESDPNHSGGEINAHKKFTKKGDDVVIIGGGRGVSAVRASNICYPGKVYVYEASLKYVELIDEVLSLNDVTNCEIIHGCVGPSLNVWGPNNENVSKNIKVEDLPRCDVLEMDCEGAEYQILDDFNNFTKKPRVIIVEVHPHRTNKEPKVLLNMIKELGYNIKYRSTNNGKELSEQKLKYLLRNLYLNQEEKQNNRPKPPVIAASLGNS